MVGEWPEAARALTVVLIPKAKGGTRPIAMFPALHRLWTRSRRPTADAWERKLSPAFFATGKGQAGTDTVWAQALKA